LLSLGRSQSFALEDVKQFLNPKTVREVLIQALLDAPMFIVRWRWNAVCSLAVKRFSAGRKVRPHLLRMQAEDLVTAVFPDQLACLENIVGDRQIPDHPLVRQTIDDCLTEAMDVDRLIETLAAIASGAARVVCLDLPEPSPLAAEIINAKVYSFLDGAPLEERRTRAVSVRRVGDGRSDAIPGLMDPSAVDRVRREVWPEPRDIEEMHDALQCVGFFRDPAETTPQWTELLQDLAARGRSLRLPLSVENSLWIAAERWPQFRAIYPDADPEPRPQLPHDLDGQLWRREAALAAVLRSRLAVLGPISAVGLAEHLAVPSADIQIALAGLEQEGTVLRGMFPPREDWCDRGLAARIQRYTRESRRQEVRTVSPFEFMAFLVRWQRVDAASRGKGVQALASVLRQLEAFDAPAAAWEDKILAARMDGYASTDLDWVCQSGQFAWLRLRPGGGARTPVATTPIVLVPRRELARWLNTGNACSGSLTANARRVEELLRRHGALFYDELLELGGLLPSVLEEALAELVSLAAVTADGFSGLRALLVPSRMKHRYKGLGWGLEHAGRWSLVGSASPMRDTDPASFEEHAARVLLQRYGVVFRALLAREVHMPPWSSLVRVFRQLEARGEIRGGRFVSGGFGEQYALPEVLDALSGTRDSVATMETWISVHDPLNLPGILYPGRKCPASIYDRILLRAGQPVAAADRSGRIQPWQAVERSDVAAVVAAEPVGG
jgi:ATP-dependent Lhr-like helicase